MAATDSSPLTWRSATLAAALLAAVGVLAGGSILAQRPQGPPMGATAASTILDETGKPVGAGPPIGIIGPPAASGPAAGADDPAVAALWWFAGFLDAYARLERDMAMIKTVLRANWIAIRELEADLVADRATLDNARGDQLRSYMTILVNAKQQKLNELRAEQASLLKAALGRWEDFTQCLREKSAGYASLPLVQRALGGFGTFLDQKRLVGEMELNLSAGRSQEFRVLADRAQADPSLQAVTLHYRVQDYLDRGEMGMALHAARVGAARYKDTDLGGVMTTQAQSLEVAFLKLISSKADSTAAEIRRTWETYSGEVSDSTIKQGLFGSVRHGIDSLIGRTNALRDLATDSQERLVLEHNGVEVAWRLREKGLSTEEIRLMTPEKLRDTWPRVFRQTISWESADAMTLSIQAAFQNEDVKKLAFGGDMRTLDLKPSWMGQKEFDAGLFGTCVDAVSTPTAITGGVACPASTCPPTEAGWCSNSCGMRSRWTSTLAPSGASRSTPATRQTPDCSASASAGTGAGSRGCTRDPTQTADISSSPTGTGAGPYGRRATRSRGLTGCSSRTTARGSESAGACASSPPTVLPATTRRTSAAGIRSTGPRSRRLTRRAGGRPWWSRSRSRKACPGPFRSTSRTSRPVISPAIPR